jgi:formylglycine-generating enzyme required for sulfatase activity
VLAKDTPLVKDLLAKARENLPQLKGKAVRIGSMMMAVADVKDGKVYVKQEGAEMAWEMEKLDAETIFALAFGPDAAPNLVLRQKALHIFYYGATNEAGKAMKAAAEAGEDVDLYLSRMTPVLVITSSPPGAEVELEVMKDGGWQKVDTGVLKTPMRKEVSPNGTYRVTLAKDGYLGADREVKVGVAGESTASFILKKAPAWPPFRDGLVLHYSFDEAGDRVQDLSGKGNHGMVHGATWTAKGKVGGAYEFDGRSTFISRDYDDRSAIFAQNPPLSLAAWFKTSSQTPPAQSVLGTHRAGGLDGYALFVLTGHQWNGDFRGEIQCGLGCTVLSKAPVNDGRWHHVVAAWDGEQLRLFVDGIAQSSNKSKPDVSYTSRPPFQVGHISYAPPWRDSEYYFQGTIDEVMVFRRVLSPAEARQLWSSSSGKESTARAPKPADVLAWLEGAFDVPKEAKDQYGNAVRQGKNEKTGLPLEIRHKATGMHFVFIPAGQFRMGSPETEQGREADEGPLHDVQLTKPLYLGKYEVTQAEWKKVMGANPGNFKWDRNPVDQVSWDQCQDFLMKLNAMSAGTRQTAPLRLPTEAEWEYACRAGNKTRFCYGDDLNYEKLEEYAWTNANSGGRAHPVGEKKPNAWGLYDMHGNLWEFCQDWYAASYGRQGEVDPEGPNTGEMRVLRGGSWDDKPQNVRAADRGGDTRGHQNAFAGTRVALGL